MIRLLLLAWCSLAISLPVSAQDDEARKLLQTWRLLDASPSSSPWAKYPNAEIDPTAVWSSENSLGEVFWINKKDLTANGNWVSFWMNGFHITNPKVSYRRSLWKMTILCHGALRVEAFTKYGADGTVMEEKDYHSLQTTAIRPGTMYATIAETFCPSKP